MTTPTETLSERPQRKKSPPPNLSTLPPKVLDVVMKSVDLKTVQSVRKVCFKLRSHVDGVTLDSKILKAFIFFASKDKISIELKTKDDLFEVTYIQDGNNSIVDNGLKKTVENMDIGTCVGNDMGLILINQKSLVRKFGFMLSEQCRPLQENFLRQLVEHLNTRKEKLRLKYFSWTGPIDQDQILSVFETLNPMSLQKIDLTNGQHLAGQPTVAYDIQRIANTEQWKRGKTVETLGFVAHVPFSCFYKFSNAHIMVDTITVEDLVALRKRALKNPKFEEFYAVYINFPDEADFINRFGKPYKSTKTGKTWYYKFPMNENALTVDWTTQKTISFGRILAKDFHKYSFTRDTLVQLDLD
uniref:F-box domain-containing protein n=1 Tax=Caenorhabditis tropicalis TaxID=1561998 RepID=A0A1I7UWN0_9PELO